MAKLEFLSRVENFDDIRVHLAGLGLQGLFSSYSSRFTTATNAANQISIFIEALAAKLQAGDVTRNKLWAQELSTPEFQPEEPQEGELEDEGEAEGKL